MEGASHYEHRCVLRCVLAAGDRPITVLSTHFGLNPDEQENAVRTVLNLVAKDENPVMLMGDLNLRPDSPILKPLYEVFTDTAVHAPEILTFPSDVPDRKIDYILCGSSFRIQSLRSINSRCSDHRPLIAELSIG
jgi:endonuclease/exonuclease/phosphatase family metal-dependent hydrolase